MAAKLTRSPGSRFVFFLKRRLRKLTFLQWMAMLTVFVPLIAVGIPAAIAVVEGKLEAQRHAQAATQTAQDKREKEQNQREQRQDARDQELKKRAADLTAAAEILEAAQKQLTEAQRKHAEEEKKTAQSIAELQTALAAATKLAEARRVEVNELRACCAVMDRFERSLDVYKIGVDKETGKDIYKESAFKHDIRWAPGRGWVVNVKPRSNDSGAKPIAHENKALLFETILSLKDPLSGKEHLYGLRLDGILLTAADVKKLSALQELRELHLVNAGINDDTIQELKVPSQLVRLGLAKNPITRLPDHLRLERLTWIDLSFTAIGDDTWAELPRKCPKLEEIYAEHVVCSVTRIRHLVGEMKWVRSLWIKLDQMLGEIPDETWFALARTCGDRPLKIGKVTEGSIPEGVKKALSEVARELKFLSERPDSTFPNWIRE